MTLSNLRHHRSTDTGQEGRYVQRDTEDNDTLSTLNSRFFWFTLHSDCQDSSSKLSEGTEESEKRKREDVILTVQCLSLTRKPVSFFLCTSQRRLYIGLVLYLLTT